MGSEVSYVELYDGPDGKSSGSGYAICYVVYADIESGFILCVCLKPDKLCVHAPFWHLRNWVFFCFFWKNSLNVYRYLV